VNTITYSCIYRNAIKETKDKVDVIDKRLETLYEDRLDGRITTPDYDKYVTKYKAEKEELEYRLVEYTNNDKSFILTATHLLELAQNARSIFQSSQPAQKNKILKALLANCQINEKRLQLNLLKPFSVLIDSTLSQNWLPGSDSNRRPID
jgi:site-specific DNA recombinase